MSFPNIKCIFSELTETSPTSFVDLKSCNINDTILDRNKIVLF